MTCTNIKVLKKGILHVRAYSGSKIHIKLPDTDSKLVKIDLYTPKLLSCHDCRYHGYYFPLFSNRIPIIINGKKFNTPYYTVKRPKGRGLTPPVTREYKATIKYGNTIVDIINKLRDVLIEIPTSVKIPYLDINFVYYGNLQKLKETIPYVNPIVSVSPTKTVEGDTVKITVNVKSNLRIYADIGVFANNKQIDKRTVYTPTTYTVSHKVATPGIAKICAKVLKIHK